MISILMPIYNGIEFIDESVSSILNQTYTEWELIIGVNGHGENSETYQIAKKYEKTEKTEINEKTEKKNKKVRVLDLFYLKGKSNALNAMIPFCSFPYVALLDVDDIWHKEKLYIQSQILKLNIYDVVGTRCIYFGDSHNIPELPLRDKIQQHDFFAFNPIINSSVIIKKELCHWEDKFNLEDYHLWLTLKGENKQFYNCIEVLVKHRIHQDSHFNAKGNHLQVKDLLNFHYSKKKNNYFLTYFSIETTLRMLLIILFSLSVSSLF